MIDDELIKFLQPIITTILSGNYDPPGTVVVVTATLANAFDIAGLPHEEENEFKDALEALMRADHRYHGGSPESFDQTEFERQFQALKERAEAER